MAGAEFNLLDTNEQPLYFVKNLDTAASADDISNELEKAFEKALAKNGGLSLGFDDIDTSAITTSLNNLTKEVSKISKQVTKLSKLLTKLEWY